ncbi:phage protein [Phocoenobacter skyensis]|uniref:Phage protein D n=1 Tax=Phocoenobacter skyensis TaxID=97481 RepID=A0A1H7XVQ6_9PAST|nr:hypothetical protein [Pasteurella skyensis]QLB23311.1 hypothetical protein A6B44_08875 [Pasteurella skyensis]SEM37724.1 hypothetical protein SAMN05444853_11460 [Pasteurella skyensis]
MKAKFKRVYKLKVGKANGKGIEIAPPFHIEFDVSKDTDEKPNVHSVRIYNLKKETMDQLSKPDQFCVLYAGYEFEDGAILLAAGNIEETYIKRTEKDVIFNIDFLDGWVAIRDTAVSLGYANGISAKAIIKEIANQMGLSLMMNENLPDRVWRHGFSFYGAAHQALHKVVRGAGLEWSIQNNTLQIIKEGSTTSRKAVVFNSESGMLGSPERIRISAKEKKNKNQKKGGRQEKNGWKIRSLLTPQVNAGDRIKIESKDVSGFFRVDNVKHSGNFSGNRWETIMEVRDV